MSDYIWGAVIVVLFAFSLWSTKREYHRGFHDGAINVLNEWKDAIMTGGSEDEQ